MDKPPFPKARRPLRDVVCDIDRDILKLLMRRYNYLRRMRSDKGFLDAAEERFLRASWKNAMAGVSSDARLSAQFFSLMQELEFFPRPEEADNRATQAQARAGFNLAPMQKPVRLDMPGPLCCRAARGLLALAAAAGSPLSLEPCLMNTPALDCLKMLNQAGANLSWKDGGITALETETLGTPDKALHVGDSAWNFYLILAHYLGRPSRVRLSGDSSLKLADFSAVRRFLPALGARLAHVIPKSNGLPARLECSGMLPDAAALPRDAPPELGEALLLAARGYPRAFTLDVADHPHKELLRYRVLPLLRTAGVNVESGRDSIRVTPGALRLPRKGVLPMEPDLALFLLALPLALSGEVRLGGFWPSWPQARAGLQLLTQAGLDIRENRDGIQASAARIAAARLADLPPDFPEEWLPLPLALASCAALRGGDAEITALLAKADDNTKQETYGFLHAAGLTLAGEGKLRKKEQETAAWNAPSPVWALAFALTACARPHLRLGNPSVMAGLYPGFWTLYNGLPEPAARKTDMREAAPPPAEKTPRRRIVSAVPAAMPTMIPGKETGSESLTETDQQK
ncbi:MAG: 3-phosphoshikimate 1-carboxyvinyltransferase [Desulfovibrio sp.]|jgi:5-enolpyruvylshikimate-3-phosphate synthase|nr:3-phosphoshikimate 1-carboxyvinyltransferase [Desulfovibrio sp.]